MFPSGAKIKPNNQLGAREYPQLTGEYTVKFTFMTDSFTWVVLEEFPEKIFNAFAFDYEGTRTTGFAIKSSSGGYLITDLEHLNCMERMGKVFGYKEVQSLEEALEYFSSCAVCGKKIDFKQKYGLLKRGDLVILPICPDCCHHNPDLKPVFPGPPNYDNYLIDWDDLDDYGETINRPGLADEIQEEINAVCDHCEKGYDHPDCLPGECPYSLLEDYLAMKYPELYAEVRKWYEDKLRQEFPNPSGH